MAEPPKSAPDSRSPPKPSGPKLSGAKPKGAEKAAEKSAKTAPEASARRRRGFASLGDCAAPLMRPTFEKRGFSEARIAADWPAIVGVRLARLCRPIKIVRQVGFLGESGGLLVVGARGGAAMELTYAAPQIVERVNVFYGRRAVERLKVDQTLAPSAPALRRAPPPESPPPLEKPLAALDHIDDPALRAALERLARNRASSQTFRQTSRKAP